MAYFEICGLTIVLNQDEEDIDCDDRLSSKHRKKKNKVMISSCNCSVLLSGPESLMFVRVCQCFFDFKVSVCGVLSIPTVWFSFTAFIVATACNGFLSINLEPQVLS